MIAELAAKRGGVFGNFGCPEFKLTHYQNSLWN